MRDDNSPRKADTTLTAPPPQTIRTSRHACPAVNTANSSIRDPCGKSRNHNTPQQDTNPHQPPHTRTPHHPTLHDRRQAQTSWAKPPPSTPSPTKHHCATKQTSQPQQPRRQSTPPYQGTADAKPRPNSCSLLSYPCNIYPSNTTVRTFCVTFTHLFRINAILSACVSMASFFLHLFLKTFSPARAGRENFCKKDAKRTRILKLNKLRVTLF